MSSHQTEQIISQNETKINTIIWEIIITERNFLKELGDSYSRLRQVLQFHETQQIKITKLEINTITKHCKNLELFIEHIEGSVLEFTSLNSHDKLLYVNLPKVIEMVESRIVEPLSQYFLTFICFFDSFRKFSNEIEHRTGVSKMFHGGHTNLDHHTIFIVSRIPRYVLLVSDLLKQVKLQAVDGILIERIEKLLENINSFCKRINAMVELYQRLDGYEHFCEISYISVGITTTIKKQKKISLFNKLLSKRAPKFESKILVLSKCGKLHTFGNISKVIKTFENSESVSILGEIVDNIDHLYKAYQPCENVFNILDMDKKTKQWKTSINVSHVDSKSVKDVNVHSIRFSNDIDVTTIAFPTKELRNKFWNKIVVMRQRLEKHPTKLFELCCNGKYIDLDILTSES